MSSNLKRRRFLEIFSKSTMLGVFAPALTQVEIPKGSDWQTESGHSFLTKPYLQNPGATSMTVMWLTTRPSYSWVEFQENGDGAKRTAQAISSGLIVAYNKLHKIKLEGLKPGTVYTYKVFSKEIIDFKPYEKKFGETLISEVYRFSTVDPAHQEMSMLIFNDIHDRPHSFGELEKLNKADPYDLVFLNGDMFDHQESEQQLIDHLITPCSAVFASETPFLFVRGNHETRGKFAYKLAEYFENIDMNPYFSFRLGPVHFIALDTGEDKEDSDAEYDGLAVFDPFREKQALWLEKELQNPAARKALYRVVLMHIPPYHSGEWHGTRHCRKLFSPIFEKYNIDLVISGHTHRYGVHKPQPDHSYPIVIGGGPKDGSRTLIKLKATPQQLMLSMIGDSGEEVGSYSIKPQKG